MKLCALLCAAMTLAAEDRTPPTISLTLPALTYADRNCATHKCDDKVHAHATPNATVTEQNTYGKYNSATCEYGASAADCPMPVCKAFDHHDLHCKAGDSYCAGLTPAQRDVYCHDPHYVDTVVGAAAQSQQNKRNTNATKYSRCTHEFACSSTIRLINNDNDPVTSGSQVYSSIDRNLRSEWLITYDATDDSDNHAESVSFAMIFQDTQAPSLETEFCKRTLETGAAHRDHAAHDQITVTANEDGTGGTTDDCTTAIKRKFAQSCTECQDDLDARDEQTYYSQTCSAPCTHALVSNRAEFFNRGFYSEDDYDGNVTANVAATLTDPNAVEHDCTNGCNIDTHILGTWTLVYTSKDNAQIYGTNEADNEVTQTVTIEVKDSRKPQIFVDDFPTSSNDFNTRCDNAACVDTDQHDDNCVKNDDPILECVTGNTYVDGDTIATGTFVDPGATCKDLRESWTSGGWVWESVVGTGTSAVNVASLDKTDSNNYQFTCNHDGSAATTHYVNEYTVSYACDDAATPTANSADAKFRTVRVEDTRRPTVNLVGNGAIVNSAGFRTHAQNGGFEDKEGYSNTHDSHASCQGHNSTSCKGGNSTGFLNWDKLGVGTTKIVRTKSSNTDYVMNGHLGGKSAGWKGATCSDECNSDPVMVATLHHGFGCTGNLVAGDGADGELRNFPEFTSGDYSIKYTCTDGDNNDFRPSIIHSACRNITNVDATKPIIQILGSDVMTLEATHEGNYVDDGAVCYDQVDGVISQNVEVSGDVVNMAKVGKYTITYNCKDSAGNVAPTESRVVWVERTGCPVCEVTNCNSAAYNTGTYDCSVDHEASFDYVDAGAACSDDIDGTVMYNTTNPVDVEVTGTYIITYKAKNSVNLYNDDCTNSNGAVTYFRTVHVQDTLKPLVVLTYNGTEVARGDATDHAVHDTSDNGLNPARLYMAEAEASSTHAWVAGAAAAAVAGVALLVHSTRRAQQVATSVPV